MKYKFSQYNIISKIKDEVIIFNTISLAMGVLDSKYIRVFKEMDKDKLNTLDEDEKEILFRNGFIIKDDYSEQSYLKEKYWNNKFNSNILNMSIMTTLECNFRCVYCFEERRKSILLESTQRGICNYIKKNINSYEKVHIDWYGGEPLLQKDIIVTLSKKIISICNENEVDYSASITTNGYLLEKWTEQELLECNIRSVQVTLDGTKEQHDLRRKLIDGKGTYEKIVHNLKQIENIVEIDLRVNVDYSNISNIEALFDELKKIGLEKYTIAIKGVVSAEANPCEEKVIPEKILSQKIIELYKYAQKLGIKTVLFYPLQFFKKAFCVVDTDTQFIIS